MCSDRLRVVRYRGVPLVATNDVRFVDAADFDAHEIRACICNGYTLKTNVGPVYIRSSSTCAALG